jgi:hypothetical protein
MVVRPADPQEEWAIRQLRDRHARAFVGPVAWPVNVTWFVVEWEGTIRACGAFAVVTNGERAIIATDVYDDGTRAGKRALSLLLDDAGHAKRDGVKIYAIVPLDRPQLVRHLERRGMTITGYSME